MNETIELIEPAPVVDESWTTKPWPLPEPMTAAQYQRDAIASANSTMPDDEVAE